MSRNGHPYYLEQAIRNELHAGNHAFRDRLEAVIGTNTMQALGVRVSADGERARALFRGVDLELCFDGDSLAVKRLDRVPWPRVLAKNRRGVLLGLDTLVPERAEVSTAEEPSEDEVEASSEKPALPDEIAQLSPIWRVRAGNGVVHLDIGGPLSISTRLTLSRVDAIRLGQLLLDRAQEPNLGHEKEGDVEH